MAAEHTVLVSEVSLTEVSPCTVGVDPESSYRRQLPVGPVVAAKVAA